ncbi:hypothetical protein ACF1DY_11355 [Streptomyces albus]
MALQPLLNSAEGGHKRVGSGAGGQLSLLELAERLDCPGQLLLDFGPLPFLMEPGLRAARPGHAYA